MALTKNINHRRFAASFHLKEVTSQDQDLYRCVTQSERGSGVSNFAALIVRGEDFEKHFQGYFIDFLLRCSCKLIKIELHVINLTISTNYSAAWSHYLTYLSLWVCDAVGYSE